MSGELASFRALLRLCRECDRRPAGLVPLVGRPPRLYDSQHGKALRTEAAGSPFVEDAVWEACGGSTEFAHPAEGGRAAAAAARRLFARARGLGLPCEADGRLLLRRLRDARAVAEDVGAVPGRAQAPAADDAGGAPQGPRAPAEGAAGWQRLPPGAASRATAGEILITHPLSCLFQSVFDQAVMLVDRADERARIVTGIVLNSPTGITLGQILQRRRGAQDRELEQRLSAAGGGLLGCRVFRGGPVIGADPSLEASLRWLHAHGEGLEGARQVAPSMWLGGDPAEIAQRAGGDLSGVRCFLGCASWAPVQLAIELERGVWVRARWRGGGGGGGGAGDADGGPRGVCFGPAARDAAWRSALRAAGAEVLAGFPTGLPGVSRRLRGYLEGARRRSPAGPARHAEAEEDERAFPGASAAAARSCGTAVGGRAAGARMRRAAGRGRPA